jgi:hypothetical protein
MKKKVFTAMIAATLFMTACGTAKESTTSRDSTKETSIETTTAETTTTTTVTESAATEVNHDVEGVWDVSMLSDEELVDMIWNTYYVQLGKGDNINAITSKFGAEPKSHGNGSYTFNTYDKSIRDDVPFDCVTSTYIENVDIGDDGVIKGFNSNAGLRVIVSINIIDEARVNHIYELLLEKLNSKGCNLVDITTDATDSTGGNPAERAAKTLVVYGEKDKDAYTALWITKPIDKYRIFCNFVFYPEGSSYTGWDK